jgi:hypothetical protein
MLPKEMRRELPIISDTDRMLRFGNGSAYAFGMTKGAPHMALHVHEYGRICEKAPERAEEIMRSSCSAVQPDGTITIEGMAASGCLAYRKLVEMARAQINGMKLFFLPWHEDECNKDNDPEHDKYIAPQCQQYFDRLESDHGVTLTTEQKRFYAYRTHLHGDSMHAEYPSTLDEVLSAGIA